MYCSKCGQQIIEGAQFCQKCGNRVATQTTPSAPAQAAPPETEAAYVKTDETIVDESGFVQADAAAMSESGFTGADPAAMYQGGYAVPQMPQNAYAQLQMPQSQYAAPVWQDGYGQLQQKRHGMSKGLFIAITSFGAAVAGLLGVWIGTSIAGLL